MEDQQNVAGKSSTGQTAALSESADQAAARLAVQTSTQSRADEASRQRRLQGLQMQRERILSERTSSPHRRSALENALASIERELEQLGWTIHI